MPKFPFFTVPKARRSRQRPPNLPRMGRLTPRRITALLLMLFTAFFGYAFCKGKVVRVTDGDTIMVLSKEGDLSRIRLYGVDAPESAQKGGAAATRFAESLASFKEVDILVQDKDQYGRSVALVRLPDGKLLNEELIRSGHAWVYRSYCDQPICLSWLALEKEAKEQRLGLWQDKKPMPPWQWRRQHGGRSGR